MIVEVWENKDSFKKNCGLYCSPDLEKQTEVGYITITNNNKETAIDKIISTFQFTK